MANSFENENHLNDHNLYENQQNLVEFNELGPMNAKFELHQIEMFYAEVYNYMPKDI